VGLEREEGGFVEEVWVVAGVEEGVDTDKELLLPGTVEREVPAGELPMFEEAEQVVDVPAWTWKGAVCTVLPVESRREMSRLVPAATVTTQVNEVPVRLSQEKRAGAEGLAPG